MTKDVIVPFELCCNLCYLPAELIEKICQLMIDSGNFGGVLNLRLTCTKLNLILKNSELTLRSLTVHIMSGLRYSLDEKLEIWIEFLRNETKWKFDSVCVNFQNDEVAQQSSDELETRKFKATPWGIFICVEFEKRITSFLHSLVHCTYKPLSKLNCSHLKTRRSLEVFGKIEKALSSRVTKIEIGVSCNLRIYGFLKEAKFFDYIHSLVFVTEEQNQIPIYSGYLRTSDIWELIEIGIG